MKTPQEYEEMAAQLDAVVSAKVSDFNASSELESAPEIASYKAGTQVLLLNGAYLTPEPVRWLWPGWLAYGKLHLLAGAPGQGKTTIAMALGAVVTGGAKWPDGLFASTGSILIWSGEDDPADTLLPRLLASGADRTKCYFVSGMREKGKVRPFDLAKDLTELEAAAQAIGDVKLIIVDPIVNAVTGDSHKNTEVRRNLQPLVDLGLRLNAAILGITHFSKGGADLDPAARVMGSVAFTAFARVVMVAAKAENADGEERRVLARAKSNIGSDSGGFAYEIDQIELEDGIWSSKISWGDELVGSARDLLSEPEKGAMPGKRSAVDSAKDFLRQILCDGPMPVKKIEQEAGAAGVSWSAIKRAYPQLNIIPKKSMDHWYWQMPKMREGSQEDQDAQGSQVGIAASEKRSGPGEPEEEQPDVSA
ncbi:AAA family ATPase [Limnohabitans sp.]|uniref:AAA family ATPase n=1 Tax=Limnohabitans sp. TaxID=1907725 RepID=UPI00289D2953|nr:AAA family ATPase [Limnohabitans sp.]